MTRKLPKATDQTLDGIKQETAPQTSRSRTTSRTRKTAPKAESPRKDKPQDTSATTEPTSPTPEENVATKVAAPDAHQPDHIDPRREEANAIVTRYAGYAAIGGVLPLPVVDAMSVVSVVVWMADKLAALYRVPFDRREARSIIAGFVAGGGQIGAGMLATGIWAKVLPGAQIVGCAAASATSAGLTHVLGQAFIRHFEAGETSLRNLDPSSVNNPTSRQ